MTDKYGHHGLTTCTQHATGVIGKRPRIASKVGGLWAWSPTLKMTVTTLSLDPSSVLVYLFSLVRKPPLWE